MGHIHLLSSSQHGEGGATAAPTGPRRRELAEDDELDRRLHSSLSEGLLHLRRLGALARAGAAPRLSRALGHRRCPGAGGAAATLYAAEAPWGR